MGCLKQFLRRMQLFLNHDYYNDKRLVLFSHRQDSQNFCILGKFHSHLQGPLSNPKLADYQWPLQSRYPESRVLEIVEYVEGILLYYTRSYKLIIILQ